MGVISYASAATTPIQEAVSTIVTSATTTEPTTTTAASTTTQILAAAASASSSLAAANSTLPAEDEDPETLPNFIPAYVVVLSVPVFFCLVAGCYLLLDSLEARRKAARQDQEDIELRNLRRHWFPWREALDDDEVRAPYVRPPPPPRPDRRTRKEREADEAAARNSITRAGGGIANRLPGSSFTPSTAVSAGSPSQARQQPRRDTAFRTGDRERTSRRRDRLPLRTSREEWPKMQPARGSSRRAAAPPRASSPPSGPRVADLEGVFVVGCDSDEEGPGRPGGQAHRG